MIMNRFDSTRPLSNHPFFWENGLSMSEPITSLTDKFFRRPLAISTVALFVAVLAPGCSDESPNNLIPETVGSDRDALGNEDRDRDDHGDHDHDHGDGDHDHHHDGDHDHNHGDADHDHEHDEADHDHGHEHGDADHDHDDHGHDHGHSHIIHSHKPRTYPQAVAQLRRDHDRLILAFGGASPEVLAKQLSETYDVTRWLPSIAGDSDMPEPLWIRVRDQSERNLLPIYREALNRVQRGDRYDYRAQADQVEGAIDELQEVLDASEPEWYRIPIPFGLDGPRDEPVESPSETTIADSSSPTS